MHALPERGHFVIFLVTILVLAIVKNPHYRGLLTCSFTAAKSDILKVTPSTFNQMKRCCQAKIHEQAGGEPKQSRAFQQRNRVSYLVPTRPPAKCARALNFGAPMKALG